MCRPGVTRDAVAVEWEYDGRPMCLVDTAGMRRWGSVRLATHGSLARLPGTDACRAVCFVQWDLSTPLEALSVEAARRALSKAHVVVLVIDATVGLTKQDLTIAQQVLEEGRALVVGLNKIDASEAPRMLHTMMEEALEEIAVDARGVECVSMSALTGSNVGALMPAVLDVYDKWNVRVPTSLLNRWLWRLSQVHPPPAARKTTVVTGSGRDKGRAAKSLRLKLKYLTQVLEQQAVTATRREAWLTLPIMCFTDQHPTTNVCLVCQSPGGAGVIPSVCWQARVRCACHPQRHSHILAVASVS